MSAPGHLNFVPVVYNSATLIPLGGGRSFREVIRAGALRDALADPGIAALRDHSPSLLLGRTGSGTLTLHDGALGLRARVELPNTELGRETAELARRGDLSGASFGMSGITDEWRQGEAGGPPTRIILRVGRIFDVSPVTYPAYSQTSVGPVRALSMRSARLALYERVLGPEQYGRRIDRPSWFSPGFARRGCACPSECRSAA